MNMRMEFCMTLHDSAFVNRSGALASSCHGCCAHLDCVAFTGTVFSLALSVDRRSSRMVGADSPVPVPPCVPELRSRPSPVGTTTHM